MRRLPLRLWLALLLAAGWAGAAHAQVTGDLVDRSALRVCADPNELPYSNEAGEGFENRIAELLAQRLKVPLEYTWYPQSVGFVRNTLRARQCDLIMGVVAADELVQNTNPYYRSTYVLVVRNEDKDRLTGLDSPDAAEARFGVVAGTPPSDLLMRRGLLAHAQPYQLVVDTRVDQPVHDALRDLTAGTTDAALLWGPMAGYWIKKEGLPLTLTPLPSDPHSRVRMDFRISMGIRPNELDWKHQLNDLLRELQPEIDTILADYGIPTLDAQGRLIQPAQQHGENVPEPDGYRLHDYRAPVPATLKGATVLDAPALARLLAERHPVLVDVLPKQRKPADRDPDQLWIEPRRDDIAGSAWLPNTGYGELPPDFRRYLQDGLAELTGNDPDRPLVFYCDPDCWQSWNAAKRAHDELGYRRVYWFPGGAAAWKLAGNTLTPAHELPMPGWSG